MIKVVSSNLSEVGYDEEKQEFDVKFNTGETYRYFEVPRGIYDRFLLAGSKGKFFDIYVRRAGYQFKKLDRVVTYSDPVAEQFKEVIEVLGKHGVARIEQDENGCTRVLLTNQTYVRELASYLLRNL